MKPCPICGALNLDDAPRCERCGADLRLAPEMEEGTLCSVCGYRNPPEAIFCEQCGARLETGETPEAEAAAPEGTLETLELAWLSELEDLFQDTPAPPTPSPSEATSAEIRPGAEAAPPEHIEETPVPTEGAFGALPEQGEEEGIPFMGEPSPPGPFVEAPFQAPEGLPPEETPEGFPPEAAAPWSLPETLSEEPEAFPFIELPAVEEREEAAAFPWLETPPETPGQAPEVPLPEAGPFTEWPPEWGMEGVPPVEVPPLTEEPPITVEPEAIPLEPEAEAPPEWLRAFEVSELPAPVEEVGQEALPATPAETAAESPPITEEGLGELLQAEPGVFLAEEPPPPPAEVPPFTDLEAVLAEMPEWLRTLPSVPEEGEEAAEALPAVEPTVVETQGPLAGLVDVLPPNFRLVEPHGPSARLHAEPAPELQTRAQAWRSLLNHGLEFLVGEWMAAPAQIGLGATLERWLLFALLLGALILGLYWPIPFFQPSGLIPPIEFLAALDQTAPGGLALIAVDYGPDRAAELDAYLQGVLERLTAREVRVLTVSLSPWGAAQAAQVIGTRSDYGQGVLHLGYSPGQEVGIVRLLAQPMSQLGADYYGQSLSAFPMARELGEAPLADRLSLVVLITGSPDALRGWIQQARGLLAPGVPIVAAVSASLAPYALPYQESGQLRAVAVGLQGALSLNGPVAEGSPAFFDLQAQTTLQVVIIVLVGVGVLIRLFQRPAAV